MWWRIGTIGFAFADWLKVFYPAGARSGEYLKTYGAIFDTVELDTTFHATPPMERVQKWAAGVPNDFVFCAKTPRQITHDSPIASGVPAMRYFLRALTAMHKQNKLGPILLQFPPGFSVAEISNLDTFLKGLPQNHRYAVEFRNPTWETQQTLDLLKQHRVAWVAGDYGVDPFPIHVTTDFLYLRFIGIHKQFESHERERIDMGERLAWWQTQVAAAAAEAGVPPEGVYAFFNNDYAGHAPATADRFGLLVGHPKKIPEPANGAATL